MKRTAMLVGAVLLLTVVATVGVDAERSPSTQEERTRLVAVTERIVNDPLNPSLKGDRDWALRLVYDVPDIQIWHCDDTLGPLVTTNYKYNQDLTDLFMLAEASYVVQHREQSTQREAEANLAATQAVLRAYEAIVAKDPSMRLNELDAMVAMRDSGKLREHVRQQTRKCNGS